MKSSSIGGGFLEIKPLVDKSWIREAIGNDVKFQEILNVAKNTNKIKEILDLSIAICAKYSNIVVVGIGGSTLAARAYYDIIGAKSVRNNVYFLDNLDVSSLEKMLEIVKLRDTFFVFISKSGGTIETIVQMCAIIDTLVSAGMAAGISQSCLAVTGAGDSAMRKICNKYAIPTLEWSGDISGRFSAFSNNINLVNAIIGVDIKKSCSTFVESCEMLIESDEFIRHLNFTIASLQQNISSTVVFGYSDKLSHFIDWYVQIWAESVGKNGLGTNPCKAIGPLDQHSKLQLFLDGKKDKIFTIIAEDCYNSSSVNWGLFADCGLSNLNGAGISEIICAFYNGLTASFKENNIPVRNFIASKINVEFLSEMMAFYMLETVLSCHYLNTNPYNQPKVEESKRHIYSYLQNL